MQYSYNWLKELTKTKKNPKELAEMVMLKGFELEEMEELKKRFEKIVVGEILDIKEHPQADKLQIIQVNIGDEKKQIVCGAYNIKIGDKVPVALVGAIIPLNKLGIKKAKIREIESQGMLCAEDELGLGKDGSGIMILDGQAKIGQSLVQYLELDDTILDFDILPNRAHDCLSYRGMANEICVMERHQLKIDRKNSEFKIHPLPSLPLRKGEKKGNLSIDIKDKKLCPRYIGVVMDNIKIKSSPKWMQARLVASGMEPINNVVDITNYVMLEIGNPLHAFDFRNILDSESDKKADIIIRKAKSGEKLELLDGTNLELTENDLVIATENKAIALAGIKGGKNSGINESTTRIILEAANFDSYNIRKSRQHHSLQTEAQTRFEKGMSPMLAEKATQRAVELFEKYAGAKVEEVLDVNYFKNERQLVEFDFNQVEKLLGYKIKKEEALEILKNLGFVVKERKGDLFKIQIPYWRLDIEGQEDLIEEIGRVIGYEKIENQSIKEDILVVKKNKTRNFGWKIRELLTGLGFDEVTNYSFYSKEEVEVCGIKKEHFEIENPLSREQTLMRKTLLSGIIKNVTLNEKNFDNFLIFEIGRIYEEGKDGISQEKIKISGAILDKSKKSKELFYDLKGKLESLFDFLTKDEIVFKSSGNSESDNIFHKSRTADIEVGNQKIGRMGEVDSKVSKFYGFKNVAVVFEIDLEVLRKISEIRKEFIPLRKFPTADRDISMFVNRKIEVAKIEKIIKNSSKYLLSVKLFDIFQKDDSEKKSLAFHLKFGTDDHTLKNQEIDLDMTNIIKNLEKEEIDVRKG